MSTTTEKSPTKIDPLRNGDSFSNNDERIDFCHSVLRSIPIFLENPADESLEGDVKGCLLKLTTGDFSTTMNKDNEDALRILKGDEITLGTQRMALEDQMADWIDALEVKETDVANLHDRKTELEEDIEDVKNRVKSKYSEERARMERKMQDLTERCELEIQTNTESERATLNVTKLLLNEKQDDVHAFNETLTHREKTIKELDLKGELKHEEVEAKARDYAKLDVVNCGVGNNTLCITHEQFRTLIQEGLSNLQPDSVPEWIRSQHLGRESMQKFRKLLKNIEWDLMGKKIKIARVQSACGGRSEASKDERERTIEYLYSCFEEKPPLPSALKEESGAFLSPSGIKRSREVEYIVNKYSSATKKPRTAAAVGIADDRGDADSCASPSNKKGRRVGAPPDSESSRAWAESLGPPRSEPFSPGVFN